MCPCGVQIRPLKINWNGSTDNMGVEAKVKCLLALLFVCLNSYTYQTTTVVSSSDLIQFLEAQFTPFLDSTVPPFLLAQFPFLQMLQPSAPTYLLLTCARSNLLLLKLLPFLLLRLFARLATAARRAEPPTAQRTPLTIGHILQCQL